MIAFARNMRLLPIVLIAIGALFALKVLGLVLEGGYILADTKDESADITGSIPAPKTPVAPPRIQAPAQVDATVVSGPRTDGPAPWAQRMFGYPEGANPGLSAGMPQRAEPNRIETIKAETVTPAPMPSDISALPKIGARDDITGSAAPKSEKPPEPKPGPAKPEAKPDGTPVPLDPNRLASPSERALLERLQERRQELEARARELEIRENLLKVGEKRLETRATEVKETETKNQAASKVDEGAAERYKGLVTMYENMKAKDAAKIFDRLEMRVLIEVVSQINPRRMSDILGQMQPEAAEKLTVELANRGKNDRGDPTKSLPKIEGRPTASN